MPHPFKASPDHLAVDYLVRPHADLGGWMQAKQAGRAQARRPRGQTNARRIFARISWHARRPHKKGTPADRIGQAIRHRLLHMKIG